MAGLTYPAAQPIQTTLPRSICANLPDMKNLLAVLTMLAVFGDCILFVELGSVLPDPIAHWLYATGLMAWAQIAVFFGGLILTYLAWERA